MTYHWKLRRTYSCQISMSQMDAPTFSAIFVDLISIADRVTCSSKARMETRERLRFQRFETQCRANSSWKWAPFKIYWLVTFSTYYEAPEDSKPKDRFRSLGPTALKLCNWNFSLSCELFWMLIQIKSFFCATFSLSA